MREWKKTVERKMGNERGELDPFMLLREIAWRLCSRVVLQIPTALVT